MNYELTAVNTDGEASLLTSTFLDGDDVDVAGVRSCGSDLAVICAVSDEDDELMARESQFSYSYSWPWVGENEKASKETHAPTCSCVFSLRPRILSSSAAARNLDSSSCGASI